MASETILSSSSPNDLSCERLVVENSGKIAKSRRSKNSSSGSKYSRHKEQQRNRSPARIEYDRSDTETERCLEDEKDEKRVQRQHRPKISSPSGDAGYSSSEEISDRETSMIHHRRRFSTKRDQPTTHNEGKEEALDQSITPDRIHSEWELVENFRTQDKIDNGVIAGTTTGPESTEDEFWKCETIDVKNATTTKSKKKINRERKAAITMISYESKISRFFSEILPENGRTAWQEWKSFVEERRDQLIKIRLARNKCILEFVLIFVYCGIGGIIFHSVEGAFEKFYKCGVKRVKREFLDTLWSKSHYMREDDWKSLARTKLMEFENQLYDAYEAGMTSYSGQRNWSFVNSFVYSITVVTTIGYGHIVPVTPLGRIITIVYSLLGIPLFLILLADYGKFLTRVIKFFWAYFRRLYYTSRYLKMWTTVPVQELTKEVQSVIGATSQSQKNSDNNTSPANTSASNIYTIDDEFNFPISLAIFVLFLYTISGAALFAKLEGWPFFHSFYYVYISVSTIGFGDIVPSNNVSVLLCSLVYFVFGLSFTSMCINIIAEKLTDSFQQAMAKVGATLGIQIAENGEEDILNTTSVLSVPLNGD